MKENKVLISLLIAILTLLIGCSNKKSEVDVSGGVKNQEEIQISMEEKDLHIDIKSNSEVLPLVGDEGNFLELSPILEGDIPENIQYHWIIDNPLNNEKSRPFEMFVSEEYGGVLEITNNGETIEFGVFTQVCYSNSSENALPSYFNIILKIEDVKTLEVLTDKKIIIENRAGVYKIIRKEMIEEDKE